MTVIKKVRKYEWDHVEVSGETKVVIVTFLVMKPLDRKSSEIKCIRNANRQWTESWELLRI